MVNNSNTPATNNNATKAPNTNNNATKAPNTNNKATNNKAKNNKATNNKATNNKANNKSKNDAIEANNIEDTSDYELTERLGKVFLASQSSRIIFMTMIFLIIFFGLITLFYHNSVTRKVQTLHNETMPLFNKNHKLIGSSEIKPSFNLKESYLIYIYFENSNGSHSWFRHFKESKIILSRADDNFMIKYKPDTNQLVVSIKIKKVDIQAQKIDSAGLPSTEEISLDLHDSYENIYVSNIPHHQWLQIAIVIDNRLVDIYINKKLAVSRVIENVPILSKESILLGQEYHNPNAFLGRVEYANDLVTTMDLKALYFKNMRLLKIDPILRDSIIYETHDLIHAPAPSHKSGI